MKRIRGFGLALLFGLLVVAAAPSAALAFELRTGDSITVSDDIADDLYVFGSIIDITGDIEGDVIAFGQSVNVSGEVSGDVIAAGQTVRISAPVGGSVRAAGQDVEIADFVEEDVLLAGASVRIASDGRVGRDAALAGNAVSVSGDVEGKVLAGAETMTIASAVGGDVSADVADLTLTNNGSVGGDLTYYSDNEADLNGDVAGRTERHPARNRQRDTTPSRPDFGAFAALAAVTWIRSLVGMWLFAMLAVLALRRSAIPAADEVFARPLASAGIGLLVLVLVPPLAAFVFVLGLFIGGWWIAFALIAVMWLLAMLGLVVGALAVGRSVLSKVSKRAVHPILAVVLGLLIIWVIGIIPFVGWLAGFLAMLFGMGALLVHAYGPPRMAVTAAQVAPAPAAPPMAAPPVAPTQPAAPQPPAEPPSAGT